eukprot:TRINITY_DN18309_c0_g1_i1.p1 TRINITY_DN18309_c0_g1~~TRINITY_DN18309_c0_g1_i1.p1  ORF type:complete len:814 (+),score=160.44 TRINITY_DN18309_c0_g1_i1:89-2530(+)
MASTPVCFVAAPPPAVAAGHVRYADSDATRRPMMPPPVAALRTLPTQPVYFAGTPPCPSASSTLRPAPHILAPQQPAAVAGSAYLRPTHVLVHAQVAGTGPIPLVPQVTPRQSSKTVAAVRVGPAVRLSASASAARLLEERRPTLGTPQQEASEERALAAAAYAAAVIDLDAGSPAGPSASGEEGALARQGAKEQVNVLAQAVSSSQTTEAPSEPSAADAAAGGEAKRKSKVVALKVDDDCEDQLAATPSSCRIRRSESDDSSPLRRQSSPQSPVQRGDDAAQAAGHDRRSESLVLQIEGSYAGDAERITGSRVSSPAAQGRRHRGSSASTSGSPRHRSSLRCRLDSPARSAALSRCSLSPAAEAAERRHVDNIRSEAERRLFETTRSLQRPESPARSVRSGLSMAVSALSPTEEAAERRHVDKMKKAQRTPESPSQELLRRASSPGQRERRQASVEARACRRRSPAAKQVREELSVGAPFDRPRRSVARAVISRRRSLDAGSTRKTGDLFGCLPAARHAHAGHSSSGAAAPPPPTSVASFAAWPSHGRGHHHVQRVMTSPPLSPHSHSRCGSPGAASSRSPRCASPVRVLAAAQHAARAHQQVALDAAEAAFSAASAALAAAAAVKNLVHDHTLPSRSRSCSALLSVALAAPPTPSRHAASRRALLLPMSSPGGAAVSAVSSVVCSPRGGLVGSPESSNSRGRCCLSPQVAPRDASCAEERAASCSSDRIAALEKSLYEMQGQQMLHLLRRDEVAPSHTSLPRYVAAPPPQQRSANHLAASTADRQSRSPTPPARSYVVSRALAGRFQYGGR